MKPIEVLDDDTRRYNLSATDAGADALRFDARQDRAGLALPRHELLERNLINSDQFHLGNSHHGRLGFLIRREATPRRAVCTRGSDGRLRRDRPFRQPPDRRRLHR